MVKPVFYGIGVGPGEKGLITLKGAETLKKVSVVFTPMGKDKNPGIAYEIAASHIGIETPVVPLKFPMIDISKNQESLKSAWEENAAIILMALKSGDVAFLTLGDPFLYSTYAYIIEYLKKKRNESIDFEIETIPGVTAFSALSARLGVPLALGEETLAICSMTIPNEKIREIFQTNTNIVVMKASGKSQFLAELLKEMNLERNFIILSNIGFEEETISTRLETLESGIPYLSTILIKKNTNFET